MTREPMVRPLEIINITLNTFKNRQDVYVHKAKATKYIIFKYSFKIKRR